MSQNFDQLKSRFVDKEQDRHKTPAVEKPTETMNMQDPHTTGTCWLKQNNETL